MTKHCFYVFQYKVGGFCVVLYWGFVFLFFCVCFFVCGGGGWYFMANVFDIFSVYFMIKFFF